MRAWPAIVGAVSLWAVVALALRDDPDETSRIIQPAVPSRPAAALLDAAPSVASWPTPSPAPPTFKVEGIVQAGSNALALVRKRDGSVVERTAGDGLEDGWRVRRVDPSFLVAERDGQIVTLRPEGTPTALRAAAVPAQPTPAALPGMAPSLPGAAPRAAVMSDDQAHENNQRFLQALQARPKR